MLVTDSFDGFVVDVADDETAFDPDLVIARDDPLFADPYQAILNTYDEYDPADDPSWKGPRVRGGRDIEARRVASRIPRDKPYVVAA